MPRTKKTIETGVIEAPNAKKTRPPLFPLVVDTCIAYLGGLYDEVERHGRQPDTQREANVAVTHNLDCCRQSRSGECREDAVHVPKEGVPWGHSSARRNTGGLPQFVAHIKEPKGEGQDVNTQEGNAPRWPPVRHRLLMSIVHDDLSGFRVLGDHALETIPFLDGLAAEQIQAHNRAQSYAGCVFLRVRKLRRARGHSRARHGRDRFGGARESSRGQKPRQRNAGRLERLSGIAC